jgi:hypothetical protein
VGALRLRPNLFWAQSEAEATTEKYGLEAGLLKVMTSTDEGGQPSKGMQAKELLKRYGSAYLITSISFAIVSFAACYFAISAGGRPHGAQQLASPAATEALPRHAASSVCKTPPGP